MKAKEFIIELKKESKPRNFVAKNAKMGGAGQHKDKKKAEKQGDFKHKQNAVPMESTLSELSTEKLGQYKKAAHADAKKSDADGNYARGDKRFKGINKATNKQFDNDLKKHGQDVEEGWKDKVAAAGLAGAMAFGAGGAHARVSGDQDPGINRLTGKPIATQQATDNAPAKAEAPKGFSKEYLQAVVDGKHPRPMVSVEKAKELLKNMSESSKIPFAGKKVGQKEGPAGQLKGTDPKGYPKGKLVGGGM
jgi:hypothetical protein